MRSLFSRRNTILLALLGGVLAFISVTQTWVSVTDIPSLTATDVTVSGQQASPVIGAMALVAIAAAIVLAMVRSVGRVIIGIAMLFLGALMSWASISVLADPLRHAQPVMAESVGVANAQGDISVSPVAYLAVLGAILMLATGLIALTAGRNWSVKASKKYTRGTETPARPQPSGAQENSTTGPDTSSAQPADEPDDDALDEIDAWDELSRGEDPTT